MKKKTQEIIFGAIITLLIVTLVGGFIVSYLTSIKPILFSEKKCDSYIGGSIEEYDFKLQNRAENIGLAKVCFSVDNAYFEDNDELVQDYCFIELEINPKSSELEYTFNPTLVLDKI